MPEESSLRPIRVLVVEDHAVVRQSLHVMLDMDPDVVVVGEAVNGDEAIAKSKTDDDRQKAMAEHMRTMQENMMMARGMQAGMMGCPMMEGGMMGKGGMGMMGGGMMMDCPMMGQMMGGGMMGEQMMQRMQQMEKRMDMMQMMLEQMRKP